VRREKGKHKVRPMAVVTGRSDIENGIPDRKKVIGRVFADKIKMQFRK
jgi:hypothetical protein